MTHVADHEQIEAVLLNELDNARHGMTGDNMRLELDPLGLGLCTSSSDDFFEAAIGYLRQALASQRCSSRARPGGR
jgi:hypothetical protein